MDPAKPRPPAREFVLVQSEFYLGPTVGQDSARTLGWEKLLGQAPDHIVFNGRASQYAAHPIDVRPDELLRLYLVNAGPNRISSFHVVGGETKHLSQTCQHLCESGHIVGGSRRDPKG